jgi:hypothetical protein
VLVVVNIAAIGVMGYLGHRAAPGVEAQPQHVNTHHFDRYDLWFLQLASLAAFTMVALLCLASASSPVHQRLAFVLYLVEICVVTPSTWGSLDADLRSFIEVYLLAVIILLGTPRRSRGAWLLPSLAELTVPALVVVTQRRLVGS